MGFTVERQTFNPEVLRQLLEVWCGYWRLPMGPKLADFTERGGLSISSDALQYYYLMALDAGLVADYLGTDGQPVMSAPKRVTYRGQCFLDETREKPAWEKVKVAMFRFGARAGIELASKMAVEAATELTSGGSL